MLYKQGILGTYRKSIKSLTARVINGQNVISAKKTIENRTFSVKQLEHQANFQKFCKLFSPIYFEYLKNIVIKTPYDSSIWNYLTRKNLSNFNENGLLDPSKVVLTESNLIDISNFRFFEWQWPSDEYFELKWYYPYKEPYIEPYGDVYCFYYNERTKVFKLFDRVAHLTMTSIAVNLKYFEQRHDICHFYAIMHEVNYRDGNCPVLYYRKVVDWTDH